MKSIANLHDKASSLALTQGHLAPFVFPIFVSSVQLQVARFYVRELLKTPVFESRQPVLSYINVRGSGRRHI